MIETEARDFLAHQPAFGKVLSVNDVELRVWWKTPAAGGAQIGQIDLDIVAEDHEHLVRFTKTFEGLGEKITKHRVVVALFGHAEAWAKLHRFGLQILLNDDMMNFVVACAVIRLAAYRYTQLTDVSLSLRMIALTSLGGNRILGVEGEENSRNTVSPLP